MIATDNLVAQLEPFVCYETRMPAGLIVTVIERIEQQAAEIRRLNGELLDQQMEWASATAHNMNIMREQAAEIERLKEMAELYQLQDNCADKPDKENTQ